MTKALKSLFLLLGLIIGCSIPSFAQNFNIVDTDTTKFPTLKVKILLPDGGKASEQDFKVYDEKDPNTPLSIRLQEPEKTDSSNENTSKNRLIFILVDGSALMNGVPINSVKRALANSFGVFGPDDKVNVGFFTDSDQVTLVTGDFNRKFRYMSQEIRSKISAASPPTDSTEDVTVKLFPSIYKTLEDIDRDDMEGQKILVVISAGQNKGSATFSSDDCIRKARQMKIPLYTITYQIGKDADVPNSLSRISSEVKFDDMTTGSPSRVARTAGEIQSALSDFFAIKEEVVTPTGTTLFITFDTDVPADGNEHSYMISYKNQNQTKRYYAPLRPDSGSFLQKYSTFLIIGVGALLGIVLWMLYNKRMKQAEEERIEAEEAAEAEEQARLAAEAAQRRQQEATARQQQEQASKQHEATDQRLKALEEQNIRLQEQLRSQQLQAQNQPQADPKFDMKRTIISGGGGAPTLLVSAGAFNQSFSLNKPKIFIGRAEENDVMIPVQTVSGQHATITIENGSFYLTDLGSTNGTFVNGSRVSKTILKSGDMIKLGAANLKFHI